MAKLYASWVPGYSFVAQNMGTATLDPKNQPFVDVNGLREGFGAHYYLKPGKSNWFHVAIPTPVIVEDRRATLGRVMVLYSITEQFGALQAVDVWDGPNRILHRDGLSIDGNHAGGLDAFNTWNVNHDGIAWGVGISMLFTSPGGADIYFASAGGDFFHNI
ncbi:hypothetical protein NE236_26885 [Actinoallomurus purpureus]|uniref:hypothetical protein n=1 Tax=Actinoallomurus purpureus TaxID=478114 RepID=UPI002093F606|nr:hypothetical protein [Actinoallomurus purpureus]MCO6008604.1 hypothetical protein [Actinoallomurus purpureus]